MWKGDVGTMSRKCFNLGVFNGTGGEEGWWWTKWSFPYGYFVFKRQYGIESQYRGSSGGDLLGS